MIGYDHSSNIDMILNPDKLTQYQVDVAKAMNDIRDQRASFHLTNQNHDFSGYLTPY